MNANNISSSDRHVRLDRSSASLWRGHKQMPLRHKTYAVLEYLLEHPQQLVTKQELFDAVWPNVVVTDTVLGVCISELRQAMGDTAKRPKWIKTIYKRGYCYIGNTDIAQNGLPSSSIDEWYRNDLLSESVVRGSSDAGRVNSTKANYVHRSVCRDLSMVNECHSPRVWNVPYLRNPEFAGREGTLAEIRNAFLNRMGNFQAIFGLGGVGKTQLAAEYAYRYAQSYDQVVWIGGESATTLAMGYTKLALDLAIPDEEKCNHSSLVRAVRNWLDRHGNWLVVYDDVRNLNLLMPYLPRSRNGHVLLTSRHPDWGNTAITRRLSIWSRTESVSFLRASTGQDNAEGADELARALGDFPLALEQTSAYIRSSRSTIKEYSERFSTKNHLLMQQAHPTTNYPETIASTWLSNFEDVRRRSQLADELLSLCAIASSDRTPRDWVGKQLSEIRGKPVSRNDLSDAIELLHHYSLIEVCSRFIYMHKLVRSVRSHCISSHQLSSWT